MNKESLNPYQARDKRIAFIEKAVGEGVLDKIPVSERNQNIAFVYNLNEKLTGEEIGQIFSKPSGEPLTRQRIDQINQTFLKTTWRYASRQLKSCYPLEELLSIKIGPKSRNYFDFEKKVKVTDDYKELREFLDGFPDEFLYAYNDYHRQDEERILTNLSSVMREGGFYFSNRNNQLRKFVVEKIRAIGIPIRPIEAKRKSNVKYKRRCWIVFCKHTQRIIDALKDDPDLQRFKENPVQLVCGKKDGEIPTTAALRNKTKYSGNLSALVYETTGLRSNRKTLSTLMRGCPVPIFKTDNWYHYPIDRIKALKAFLKSKQGKI